jgi:hypothetical protein
LFKGKDTVEAKYSYILSEARAATFGKAVINWNQPFKGNGKLAGPLQHLIKKRNNGIKRSFCCSM